MKIKGLSLLLTTVMACSIIFTSCANADTEKVTKSSSEVTPKKETADKEYESKKEDTSSDKETDASSDEGEGTLSKIKKVFKETAQELVDDIDEVKGSDQDKSRKYHPGDVVSFDDFKITYKSIQKYKSDNQFLQPKKGFQYIKYIFSFENTGKDDSYVGDFSCYADGEKCDSAFVDDSDSSLLLLKLSAGRKKSGSLVYEVPKNMKLKNLELEYEDSSLWSDEKIIFLGK